MESLTVEWEDDGSDVVHPDIPISIPFAYAETGDVEHEEFLARGDVPFGLLINMEDQRPGAMTGFFNAVFYSDDNERDDDDQPIDGTSSLDRWNKLSLDPDRRVPGPVLTQVFTKLYAEYGSRTGLRASARPTTTRVPSRAQRRATGRTSPAKRAARASISAVSEPE